MLDAGSRLKSPTTVQARLDVTTAGVAQGHEAVCLFVNDDASSEVEEALKNTQFCPVSGRHRLTVLIKNCSAAILHQVEMRSRCCLFTHTVKLHASSGHVSACLCALMCFLAHCLLSHTVHFLAQVLEKLAAGGVRFIAMRCAGYDRVNLQAAARLGISVTRVPSYSPHSVAEHAVAMLLCLNRCAFPVATLHQ